METPSGGMVWHGVQEFCLIQYTQKYRVYKYSDTDVSDVRFIQFSVRLFLGTFIHFKYLYREVSSKFVRAGRQDKLMPHTFPEWLWNG